MGIAYAVLIAVLFPVLMWAGWQATRRPRPQERSAAGPREFPAGHPLNATALRSVDDDLTAALRETGVTVASARRADPTVPLTAGERADLARVVRHIAAHLH